MQLAPLEILQTGGKAKVVRMCLHEGLTNASTTDGLVSRFFASRIVESFASFQRFELLIL